MVSIRDFKYYLADPMVWFYYSEVKKTGSIESEVDNFYDCMLPIYFPRQLMYGVERESRPLKELGLAQRTDLTIRYVKNGSPKKIILVEDRRRGKETSDREWGDVLDQVVKYAELVRTEKNQNPDETIYLMVNIGTYLRFYQINPNQSEAVAFATAGGKAFELAADEEAIHTLFLQLQRLTLH